MNMKTRHLPLALAPLALLALASCEEDSEGLDGFCMEHSRDLEQYHLSAGTSTIFYNSSKAYDVDAEWLTGKYAARFQAGNRLYDNVTDNYGPVYGGYSCASCHMNAGRTSPSVWNQVGTDPDGTPVYGSGTNGMSAMLVYVARKNGVFFQGYGRVLHDQSIYGVTPEGKLEVRYDYEAGTFPDGQPYELAHPNYTVVKWYKKMWDSVKKDSVEIKPEDLFCSVRIPLRHVGMGQMMALDRSEIERLAAQSNYPEYGISGRCNYVTEKGVRSVGLSGNKAQHLDLTVELGFSSDMGATNSRYPEEVCEGQSQMTEGSMMGLTYDKLEEDERIWCATCKEGFEKPSCERVEVETDGENPQHAGVLNAFAAHIQTGAPLVADGREGINGLMLSNAIHLSSWLGETVTLPIDEKKFLNLLNERRAHSRLKEDTDVVMDTASSYGGGAK